MVSEVEGGDAIPVHIQKGHPEVAEAEDGEAGADEQLAVPLRHHKA